MGFKWQQMSLGPQVKFLFLFLYSILLIFLFVSRYCIYLNNMDTTAMSLCSWGGQWNNPMMTMTTMTMTMKTMMKTMKMWEEQQTWQIQRTEHRKWWGEWQGQWGNNKWQGNDECREWQRTTNVGNDERTTNMGNNRGNDRGTIGGWSQHVEEGLSGNDDQIDTSVTWLQRQAPNETCPIPGMFHM